MLRVEYEAILDAGLILQVDDAFLPWTYDLMVPPATMEDYREWAQLRVDALNHALRGLPEDRIRYHICWGSFNTPHVGDVPAKDIIDLVLQVQRRLVPHRDGQPAPRARVAHLGGREAARRQGADPGRDQRTRPTSSSTPSSSPSG